MSRLFYRLVEGNPPSLRDVMSYKALGRPLLNEANREVWAGGVSVQNTMAQAHNRAKVLRGKTHVAVLEIPDGANVRWERTGEKRGHVTLWGDPQELLSYVRDVIGLERSYRESTVKPCFELWDSDSANFLGAYESIPDALADLDRTFPTAQLKQQVMDLVLTLELGGDDDDTMILLDGASLYRLLRPIPASELKAS
ncbi:MAG TPA: hypothetical protein VGR22_04135 [Thermomicrobiales bacterium]|nr:hypothetical protein [Thermomicrobiales bacterium]